MSWLFILHYLSGGIGMPIVAIVIVLYWITSQGKHSQNTPTPSLELHSTQPPITEPAYVMIEDGINEWLTMRTGNLAILLGWTLILIIGVWASPHANFLQGLKILIIGFSSRILWEWSFRRILDVRARQSGLTPVLEDEFEDTDKTHKVRTLDNGVIRKTSESFPASDVEQAQKIASTLVLPSHMQTTRSYLRKRKSVFISYAWADEKGRQIAKELADMCEALDVKYYWDQNESKSQFIPWRRRVAPSLQRCTHFFLVVPNNDLSSKVIHREYAWAINRWRESMLPATVCVVEPDVATKYQNAQGTSFNLRLILAFSPKMSLAQLSDPDIFINLLQQRQRKGLFRNILSTLGLD